MIEQGIHVVEHDDDEGGLPTVRVLVALDTPPFVVVLDPGEEAIPLALDLLEDATRFVKPDTAPGSYLMDPWRERLERIRDAVNRILGDR